MNMTTQFYPRYIPPKSPEPAGEEFPERTERKKRRKLDAEKPSAGKHDTKKDKGVERSGKHKKRLKESSSRIEPAPNDQNETESKHTSHVNEPVTERTASQENDFTKMASAPEADQPKTKRKKRKRLPDEGAEEKQEETAEEYSRKHSKILSKFAKSAKPPAQATSLHISVTEADAAKEDKNVEVNELKPIPLPAPDPTYTSTSINSALPSWIRSPITIPLASSGSFEELQVATSLLPELTKAGFTKALPVQVGLLPLLLPTINQHPGDVCVSAATGSGKTLSYVLPIVQDLPQLPQAQLRALIVVPTRELVEQVNRVCNILAPCRGLRVGTAVGSHGLKVEQRHLIARKQRWDPEEYAKRRKNLDRIVNYSDDSDEDSEARESDLDDGRTLLPQHAPYFHSSVDILIATPGRLVEHIRNTRGFTLQNLQWLVIDEADRLLDESFQEWADVVNKAITDSSKSTEETHPLSKHQNPWVRGLFLPIWPGEGYPGPKKVLCSATMTKDLEKLEQLHLTDPRLVVVEGAATSSSEIKSANATSDIQLPATLEEYAVPIGDGTEKPLFLLRLLELIMAREQIPGTLQDPNAAASRPATNLRPDKDQDDSNADASSAISSSSLLSSKSSAMSDHSPARDSKTVSPLPAPAEPLTLIFTSTNESAARLYNLLEHLSPDFAQPRLALLTKSTSSSKSRKLLASLTVPSDPRKILIATDRASRGLDIPELAHIISYDVPHSISNYVHRAGRTARAGQRGIAWTLLSAKEAGWFWHVVARNAEPTRAGEASSETIQRANGQKVRKVRLEEVKNEMKLERYKEALEALKGDVNKQL